MKAFWSEAVAIAALRSTVHKTQPKPIPTNPHYGSFKPTHHTHTYNTHSHGTARSHSPQGLARGGSSCSRWIKWCALTCAAWRCSARQRMCCSSSGLACACHGQHALWRGRDGLAGPCAVRHARARRWHWNVRRSSAAAGTEDCPCARRSAHGTGGRLSLTGHWMTIVPTAT